MGEIAEESAYEYREDFKEIKDRFKVEIVHRKNLTVHWETKMNAKSPEECQQIFRKDFQNIRKKYSHDYALRCTRIK